MNRVTLYRGPSNFNGKPIVVIATGLSKDSKNSKTGAMVQIYILADGEKPSDALYKSGNSTSVCGDCKHDQWGTCYVNIGQGGNAVYGAYVRGNSPMYDRKKHGDIFAGKVVRFGTYGDPAMVPMSVWKPILEQCVGHTAYTHQWGKAWAAEYKEFCMASVDTQAEKDKAKAMGWRTFRVRPQSEANDKANKRETVCPATEEQGYRKNCVDCRLCDGGNKSVDVVIAVHGTGYKSRRFNDIMELVNKGDNYNQLVPLKISARPNGITDALTGIN